MFKLVLLMHVKFHEVLFILLESLENVWFGKRTEGSTEIKFVGDGLTKG